MEKKEVYSYYAFGYNYSLIRTGVIYDWDKKEAIDNIKDVLDGIDKLDIPVTQAIAKELKKIFNEISKIDEDKISKEYISKIDFEINKIDPALDAELRLKEIFILTEKRYSINNLMNKPENLLGKNVFNSLTDTSKRDFKSACTQIALSQPTASAFHLMRTLEEQVKLLYFSFKKTKRLEKPMWGPMINQLRTKRAPKPTEKLLNLLDGIRIHFRNPTQHPQLFYSLDEAQDLLNQTISAINIIKQELPSES